MKGIQKAFAQLRGSFASFHALHAKLRASKKSLKVVWAEVTSLSDQAVGAVPEKAESHKIVANVCEKSEQLIVRLNVAVTGHNRAETLTRLLVTESINAFDAVVQQLEYDSVSRLRGRMEKKYMTVRVPSSVAFTFESGVAATSICWKGEKSRHD